jgi:hypothetical protein
MDFVLRLIARYYQLSNNTVRRIKIISFNVLKTPRYKWKVTSMNPGKRERVKIKAVLKRENNCMCVSKYVKRI